MMRAMVMTEVGGPEVLEMRDVERPAVSRPTDLLVRISTAGVNPVDAKQRKRGTWYAAEMPVILGLDGAGVVEEAGSDLDYAPGDEVFFCAGGTGKTPGNYAEFNLVDGRYVVRKPESVPFDQVGAAGVAAITAWEALFDHGKLDKDETVLVHAGAGGVGHVAIQLAMRRECRVCTTVSTEDKARFVRSLGAEKVILYRDEDVVAEVMDWTGGKGVDVAIDLVGGKNFFDTMPCIRHYGTLVGVTSPDPDITDWMEARMRNLRVAWELMLTPMNYDLAEYVEHQRWILEQCGRMMAKDLLRIHVGETFPLDRAADAHRAIESGHTVGKIVIHP
jgi:NADPH2:quinone reductase